MKRFLPGLFVLALLLAACTDTADFDTGLAAYNRGDYATARGQWLPLAQQGNASAQSGLAIMYEGGLGVTQNYAEAAKWYRAAAAQGDARAQYNLGVMYEKGLGVPLDYKETVKWYQMAAERGYATAQYHIGQSYLSGIGVPRDYVQAHKWFNLAAAQGYREAAESREAVGVIMTPAQVTEAQRLAGEWQTAHSR